MAERNEGKPIASPEDTLSIALSLAKAGWPVFPVKLVPVTRADGTKATDKRPLVRWLDGATTDAEQIATWWGSEFPGAWVGVHAQRAGIVVVDEDIDKGQVFPKGHERAGERKGGGKANLKAAGIELPKTFKYKTRSGGRHHVYRAPEGVALTIGQDVPVPSIDIRAGHGLMVYYGPMLTEPPTLAPAPSWACITTERGERASDGDVKQWRDRASDGRPKGVLRRLVKGTDWASLDHDGMLASVSELIKHGTTPGARTAYDIARATYIERRPDRVRDWDNAAAGSIGKHGLPPATLELTKAERKVIKQRNSPAGKAEVDTQRKADYRIAKNHEARDEPKAGVRVLEDGPLAVELADAMSDRWAWTETHGLMHYDGMVWSRSEHHGLIEEVRQRLDDIEVDEHEAAVRRGDNKAIDKARTLLSRNRARAVGELVIGRLALNKRTPDADHHLLNTPTGVVDLRDGSLLPHDPALMLTRITAAAYTPDADRTTWLRALEALPAKVRPWVQVRLGQAATGHTPDDDVLVLFEGAGENGKTTVLEGARVALGEYAVTVPDRLLMANPGDHPTELTTLMGARFAVVEELPEGRNLNVKRLKDVVGTPVITARRMRQDNVSWRATHSLALSTNYLPVVAETDHGTWRRLALVRFPYRFVKPGNPNDPIDPQPVDVNVVGPLDRIGDPRLKRALSEPDEGVLAWLVEGAVAWYSNDQTMPPPPKRVRRDTEAWRLDADPVLAYVDERLQRDEGYAITTDDLQRDFNDYLERRGHRPWSAQTINARLEGHVSMAGITRKRVRFGRIMPSRPALSIRPIPPSTQAWVGLRFKAEPLSAPMSPEVADLEQRMRG